MKSNYKYLFKNVGLLTLSNFATKLINFSLVPLYTYVLTTEEYGIYDIIFTSVAMLIPILTLNIQDGVTRFALEKWYDRSAIVTVGVKHFIKGCITLLGILLINYIIGFIEIIKNYGLFLFLMFIIQALTGILSGYTRAIDKVAALSVSSIIASIFTISCNILFLLVYKWGLKGYFYANIIGPFVQCVYLFVADSIISNIKLRNAYSKEKKELLEYSKPLIANSLAWWANNAADRYIVVLFKGLSENGIYAVGSKIPSILNLFQTIFSQAWTLSAVKDFDSNDNDGFFKNMYASYNCLMTILCSAIIVMDKFLARILYAKEFYTAWQYVPWLTIAIVFGSIAGYIGGIFAAAKAAKIFAKSSVISAIINILLSLFLTPLIGALGAAIATTICYFVVWAIRYFHVKKYIVLHIRIRRDLFSYLLLVIQAIVILTINVDFILYPIQLFLFFAILVLYKNDICSILEIYK